LTQMGREKIKPDMKTALSKIKNDVESSKPSNENGKSMKTELLLILSVVLHEERLVLLKEITLKQLGNAYVRRLFIMQKWYVRKINSKRVV